MHTGFVGFYLDFCPRNLVFSWRHKYTFRYMDTGGYSSFCDGEKKCVIAGRCRQCGFLTEDSVGFSSSKPQPGANGDDSFVFGSGQGAFIKKNCGISRSDYQNQGWIQWLWSLFTQQGKMYRQLVKEINHMEMMFGVCQSSAG